MKILLAENSTCTGDEGLAPEGRAMLNTLKRSFEAAGCQVLVPTDFGDSLLGLARQCDCFLLIVPDEMLGEYTAKAEKSCLNLGCPPRVAQLCADKLNTTEALLHNGIPAPRLVHEKGIKCVVKPRYGCGSEGIFISPDPVDREGFISTGFIDGEHLSVSLVGGTTMLPLTLNRQHIYTFEEKGTMYFGYNGNEVNIDHPAKKEILDVACRAGYTLGCRGLFGVDIVYGDRPYVVDVNPRVTTAVVGLARVVRENIADLIIKARFGSLPDHVNATGSFSFTKTDLERLS